MNKCVFTGRLTAEPQLKQTPTGVDVCTFSLAVDRVKKKDKEKETDFLTMVAWRSKAEFVVRYLHKGSKIVIEAAARSRKYDKDGQTHYITEFYVDNIEFAGANPTNQQESQQGNADNFDDFTDIDDGDEKPPWEQ